MPTFFERVQRGWNAFFSRDPTNVTVKDYYGGYSYRPDRPKLHRGSEKSIVNAIINRIAIDVASVSIKHVRVDDNGRFKEEIKSGLNNCLSVEANIDQTGRQLIQDIVQSMCDEGVVAVVPVDTDVNPYNTSSFDIKTLRVGKIIEWFPDKIRIRLYNERTGKQEEITLAKSFCAVIENPLYSVMNEPNSTMQRLIRKLALMDSIDEQSSAGKLDLIIQLPYVVKTDARRQQAEQRRKDIEMQLSSSKYGIAYTDGTEKVTQLNRSLENNLLKQVEYLTTQVFSQLGITEAVFNGTANEQEMLNYQNRTIEPILSAIKLEMRRKWISKTARSQGQDILYFTDPFKLVPVNQLAEIADKLTRNEIASTNEIRAIIGWKPSDDPRADELRNKNLNAPEDEMMPGQMPMDGEPYGEYENYEEQGPEPTLEYALNTKLSDIQG